MHAREEPSAARARTAPQARTQAQARPQPSAPVPTPGGPAPEGLLALQRQIGNAAVSRLVESGEPVVQRKVGFEFEDSQWRPWRRVRRNEGILSNARNQLGGVDQVHPAERKAVLHRGRGYELEADDTPGPNHSNIEFVTKPFEEDATGVAELQDTIADMTTVLTRLDGFVGRPGPGQGAPPFPLGKADKANYVRDPEHRLSGSGGLAARNLLLSGGVKDGAFKMQATSGVPLANLPAVMERLGKDVPGETARQSADRAPERRLVVQDPAAPNEPMEVQGSAPTLARRVVTALQQDAALGPRLTGDTTKLTGFLASVLLTLKLLRRPGGRTAPVKYRLTLLPRNSYAHMFADLPGEQANALREHAGLLVDAVVAVSNARPMIRGDWDANLTAGSALIAPTPGPLARQADGQVAHDPPTRRNEALARVGIGTWLVGVTNGTDLLTPAVLQRWLNGQVDADVREDAAGAMESFGTAQELDGRADGTTLALFEHRGIAPDGAGADLTLARAGANAVDILRFFARLRAEG
ncbi:hypothetical protein KCV87_03285 [Actinosynnema pretiosum subsp. pretiosum]|uniref:Uncharacterized protein n=1 Tax=Actinosynnema pretiosum subsp. pretiosum TaxID=103721 RepID=A0AA45L9B4_9PSEU|nr:hypothetical protein KCV87_03285 [Actinosynnema pretiosum subsp. pretiosum]